MTTSFSPTEHKGSDGSFSYGKQQVASMNGFTRLQTQDDFYMGPLEVRKNGEPHRRIFNRNPLLAAITDVVAKLLGQFFEHLQPAPGNSQLQPVTRIQSDEPIKIFELGSPPERDFESRVGVAGEKSLIEKNPY
jgi:hypothetical protein